MYTPQDLVNRTNLTMTETYLSKQHNTVGKLSKKYKQSADETLVENNITSGLRSMTTTRPLFFPDVKIKTTKWGKGLGSVSNIATQLGIPEQLKKQYINDIAYANNTTVNSLAKVLQPNTDLTIPVQVVPVQDTVGLSTPFFDSLTTMANVPDGYAMVPMVNMAHRFNNAEELLAKDSKGKRAPATAQSSSLAAKSGTQGGIKKPRPSDFWLYIPGNPTKAQQEKFYQQVRAAVAEHLPNYNGRYGNKSDKKEANITKRKQAIQALSSKEKSALSNAVASLVCLESRYGRRQVGSYNPYNIKATGSQAGNGPYLFWETVNGKKVYRPARMRNFNSYGEGVNHVLKYFVRVIMDIQRDNAWRVKNGYKPRPITAQRLIDGLNHKPNGNRKKMAYATDLNHSSKIKSVHNRLHKLSDLENDWLGNFDLPGNVGSSARGK